MNQEEQQACNISTCSTITTYLSQSEVDAMLHAVQDNGSNNNSTPPHSATTLSNNQVCDLDREPSNEQIVNQWIKDAARNMQSIDTVTTLVTVADATIVVKETCANNNNEEDEEEEDVEDDEATHTSASCWPVQIAGTSILSKWVSHCDLYVSSACRTVARLYRLVKCENNSSVSDFDDMSHCSSSSMIYDEAALLNVDAQQHYYEEVTMHLGLNNYNMPRYLLRSAIL